MRRSSSCDLPQQAFADLTRYPRLVFLRLEQAHQGLVHGVRRIVQVRVKDVKGD